MIFLELTLKIEVNLNTFLRKLLKKNLNFGKKVTSIIFFRFFFEILIL